MSSLLEQVARRKNQKTQARRRTGLTLVEMLVAMAITLILVYALVVMFESVGTAVARGRSALQMQGQLQGLCHLLRQDLEGLTVSARPWPAVD